MSTLKMDSLQMTKESMLQAARLASGLSVDELSKKTLVRTGILKDLENYDCTSCGGIAYARGHLRNIAKVLKIDSKELIADFETKLEIEKRPIFDRLVDNNIIKTKAKQPITLKNLSILFGATLFLVGAIAFALQNSDLASSKIKVVTAKPKPSANSGNQSVATANQAVDGKQNVTFSAINGKSWIGIVDKDDKVIFDATLVQGQSQNFSDLSGMKVTIGNAGAISYLVNGQDKGLAGAVGEVVHLEFKAGA